MKISQSKKPKNMAQSESSYLGSRKFTMSDIPSFTEKIFAEFDKDKNNRFTKDEFTTVIKALIDLVGGEIPHIDDVEDIFNLLDVNGDETIDRQEFQSIMVTFFKLLNERSIDVSVEK